MIVSAPAPEEELRRCELCGEPMPAGERMFKYHGYSGPCPKPPLPKLPQPKDVLDFKWLDPECYSSGCQTLILKERAVRTESDNARLIAEVAEHRTRADTAEHALNLKSLHGEPCYYCGKPTNDLAGDPSEWTVVLCHEDAPGVGKAHHEGCVFRRLQSASALARQKERLIDSLGEMEEGYRSRCNYCNGNIDICVLCPEGGCLAPKARALRVAALAASDAEGEPT